jgi:hypothetical protein
VPLPLLNPGFLDAEGGETGNEVAPRPIVAADLPLFRSDLLAPMRPATSRPALPLLAGLSGGGEPLLPLSDFAAAHDSPPASGSAGPPQPSPQAAPNLSAPLLGATAAAPALGSASSAFSLADLFPAGTSALATVGLPLLAGLGAFLYPSSTASDDTCDDGHCTGYHNEEADKTPPGRGANAGQAIPESDGDAETEDAPPPSRQKTKRPSPKRMRRAFEDH